MEIVPVKARQTYQPAPASTEVELRPMNAALEQLTHEARMLNRDRPHVEVAEFTRRGDEVDTYEWHGHLVDVVDGTARIIEQRDVRRVDLRRSVVRDMNSGRRVL